MTEREAFVAAIAADPGEDTPRLVFADWLQENGEDDRACFVRLSCEIAARQREWGDRTEPPPDDVSELGDRARDLFERHRRAWLAPLLAALGCEETGPPPARGLAGRLWGRIAGEARVTNYHVEQCLGDMIDLDADGNGPVRRIGLHRGLVDHLEVDFGSPFPLRDLDAAVRLEPIRSLSFRFDANARLWRSVDVPGLARVATVNLQLPPHSRRTSAAFAELVFGGNWAGLRDLHAWCPTGDALAGFLVPHGFVHQLANTPLLSGLEALGLSVGPTDLALITASAHARNLRRFRAWGSQLPDTAAEALRAASFRPNLESLDLSLNRLGDDGVRRLAAGPWPKLRKLDLGANRLTGGCVPHLLPLAPQLTELSLASSELGDAAARELADALDPERIESFWLSYNPLSEGLVAELRERFGRRFHFRANDESEGLQQFP